MSVARCSGFVFVFILAPIMLTGCVARDVRGSAFRRPGPQDELTIFSPLDLPTPTEVRLGSGAPGPEYWQQRVDYRIDARLDAENKSLAAEMRVTYHNNSPHPLDYLWVQLEQNLFRAESRGSLSRGSDGPMRRLDQPFDGGYAILELTAGDVTLDYDVDDTLMYVRLPQTLPPGDTFEFDIAYKFNVPPYLRRMGAEDVEQGRIFEFAQWFPCVCVYDDVYGWNTLNYVGSGEFYTNFGDFQVNLTVPRNYIVAATGTLQNPEEVLTATQRDRLGHAYSSNEPVVIVTNDEVGHPDSRPTGDGPLTWRFTAENVRTFAWAASNAFQWDVCTASVTDLDQSQRSVLCQSFYPREAKAWSASHDKGGASRAVKHAIEFYSEFVYPFPYPQMTNVNGPEGGMEYPMIVFCGDRKNARGLFGVTDHEVGHNWFPMLVNTDERRHVWMDEGFNSFINVYSREDYYEKKQRGRAQPATVVGNMLRDNQQPIVTHPDQMLGDRIGFLGYRKVAAGLIALREHVLGAERFDRAFRSYVRRWAFKSPRPADFYRSIEDAAGEDLAWFWRGWFESTGTLDQSIVAVKQDREAKAATIVLANRARLVMPVELEITYADGETDRRRVPVEAWYASNRIEYGFSTDGRRVTGVRIDPDELLPDVEPRNNTWGRPQ